MPDHTQDHTDHTHTMPDHTSNTTAVFLHAIF